MLAYGVSVILLKSEKEESWFDECCQYCSRCVRWCTSESFDFKPLCSQEQVLILTGYCVRALPILVDPALDRHEVSIKIDGRKPIFTWWLFQGFIRCLSVVNESLESAVFRRLVEMIQPMVESKHGMLNTVYNGQNLLAQAVKSLVRLCAVYRAFYSSYVSGF